MKSKTSSIQISIIENNLIISEGLKSILLEKTDIEILHITSSGNEFLEIIKSTNSLPDILIIDIYISDLDNMRIIKLLRSDFPKIKLVVLSNDVMIEKSLFLIELGVSGFINKSSQKNEIDYTIEKVHKYGKYFNDKIVELMLARLQQNSQKRKFANSIQIEFTINEVLVMEQLLEQKTGKEISSLLKLSRSTVENCRCSLLKKTNSRNTVGLVIYAIANNLIKFQQLDLGFNVD